MQELFQAIDRVRESLTDDTIEMHEIRAHIDLIAGQVDEALRLGHDLSGTADLIQQALRRDAAAMVEMLESYARGESVPLRPLPFLLEAVHQACIDAKRDVDLGDLPERRSAAEADAWNRQLMETTNALNHQLDLASNDSLAVATLLQETYHVCEAAKARGCDVLPVLQRAAALEEKLALQIEPKGHS